MAPGAPPPRKNALVLTVRYEHASTEVRARLQCVSVVSCWIIPDRSEPADICPTRILPHPSTTASVEAVTCRNNVDTLQRINESLDDEIRCAREVDGSSSPSIEK